MSTTRTTAVIALIASTLAGANSAYADALRCRRALASESTRFTRSLARALQKCEDAKVNGLLPASTDCATEPTAAAKVGRAEARLARLVSSRCGGGDKVCGTADDETMPSIGWGHLGACPGLPGASCANPSAERRAASPSRSTTAP